MGMLDPVIVKPFSKVINFPVNNQTSTVVLSDTAGNPINCNYIQATIAAGATFAGYVMVTPSGLSTNPAVALGNAASGTLGLLGSYADPAELFLGGSDYCSAISLYCASATPVLLTYGVRTLPNPFKANGRNRGA